MFSSQLKIKYIFKYYHNIYSRTDINFECAKIDGKYCTCFVEDLTESDVTILNKALKVFRGRFDYRENTFTLIKDRELCIISEFFSRYGNQIKENEEVQQVYE